MSKETDIRKILEDMNSRISHIEDIEADNRKLIVKVIKQGNTIVQFLKDIEVESYESYDDPMNDGNRDSVKFEINDDIDIEKHRKLTTLLYEYFDNFESLKEFEEELKKHKENITPGQVGEA